MDKRKGIILAIVLFLIIGLGTFVFAGGSDNNEKGQRNNTNETNKNNENGQNVETPEGEKGENEGEGGSEVSDPAGGYVDNEQPSQDSQDNVADNNQSTVNDQNQHDNNNDDDDNGQGNSEDTAYQQALALIAYLEYQIANAEVRKTLDDAADYRDTNAVADKIAALTDGEDKTDLANRLAAINTILDDTVGPVIDGLPTSELTNQIVSLSVREEGVTVTLNGDAVTLDDIKNLSKDGTYKVVVTDKALNSTTAEFTVDRTPIAMSHLYILNHTYHLDSNYTDKHYTVIGNDQELYVELVLEEEFASTPVITVGDGEGVEMTCGTASWDDTLYKCDAFVTISEDMNFENGDAITFDITGVKDAAGNELEIDERLIVETDKYGEVIYDKQAPSVVWLYTLNADDDENLQVIGDGLDLLVELRVDEELLEDPTITIGGYTATLTRRDDSKGRFIYEKRITIDEKLMELVDNEIIPFVITGTDAAGNEVTFTKATTNTDAGYGEVVYDGSAPEYKNLGILNVTHLRLNNEGASESLTVANIGDEVRVLVRFDEKLDTLPTLVIGGASAEMTLMKSSAEYTYSADITLTADMFDEDGLVDFQVSDYADAVGNVGEVLDVDDIKGYENYSGVTLDTTKPLMTINGNSNITLVAGIDTYYELGATVTDNVDATITDLQPVRINYSIDGESKGPVPAVDPTKPGTYKVVYEYTDAAGNVGVDADRQDHDFIIRVVTVLPEGTTSLVDGVSYETLKDAVDAAKVNGGTVELVADVVNSTSIGIANNQEVTIDLNGNDISFASDRYFAVSGGTLTLTGEGTVKESDPYYGPILIKRSFIQGRPLTINVDEGVTLEGSSGIFVDYGKTNFAMNTTINLKGNINSVRDRAGNVGYAIYVQGNIKNTNNYPVINIYEGSEINSVGMGIYAAGYAEWNIYGGIINANITAIGIKSGKLYISGGTFTANGEENIPTPAWGNGMIGSGSALQIESNDGYAQGMVINISGGEFISENAAAIYEYPNDATTSVIDFTITGGTFKSTNYDSNFVFSQSFRKTHRGFMSNITFDKENSVLDSYLAEGYVVEEQADGTYKVVQG